MAIVFDGPVTPDAVTAFIRRVPTPAEYVLRQLLPDDFVDRNTVDLAELTRVNRVARFRTWDGRIWTSERDTGVNKQVKLPPLSTSYNKGELERLQLDAARFGAGSANPATVNAIYNDATNGTLEVQARMELARGDTLSDGRFTLGGGVPGEPIGLEADFGVPANHLITLGTPWTATSGIIADETSWVDTYVATNGFRPGGQVISTRVYNAMLRNNEVRTLASSLAGSPAIVSRAALNSVLDAFGLPPIQFVYDSKVDVDGATTNVLPDDRVFFVPPNPRQLGRTVWGVTATALELINSNESEMSFEEARGIVGLVEKVGPPYREFVFIDACGMPVLDGPKTLFVAKVL